MNIIYLGKSKIVSLIDSIKIIKYIINIHFVLYETPSIFKIIYLFLLLTNLMLFYFLCLRIFYFLCQCLLLTKLMLINLDICQLQIFYQHLLCLLLQLIMLYHHIPDFITLLIDCPLHSPKQALLTQAQFLQRRYECSLFPILLLH